MLRMSPATYVGTCVASSRSGSWRSGVPVGRGVMGALQLLEVRRPAVVRNRPLRRREQQLLPAGEVGEWTARSAGPRLGGSEFPDGDRNEDLEKLDIEMPQLLHVLMWNGRHPVRGLVPQPREGMAPPQCGLGELCVLLR